MSPITPVPEGRESVTITRDLLSELTESLACEIADRYPPEAHPYYKRKYDHEMDCVYRARALLEVKSCTPTLRCNLFGHKWEETRFNFYWVVTEWTCKRCGVQRHHLFADDKGVTPIPDEAWRDGPHPKRNQEVKK